MADLEDRAELLQQFARLPDDAVVGEGMAAAVRNKRPSSLQRERWAGTGPNYVKDGNLVGYVKRDLVQYMRGLIVVPGGERRAGAV